VDLRLVGVGAQALDRGGPLALGDVQRVVARSTTSSTSSLTPVAPTAFGIRTLLVVVDEILNVTRSVRLPLREVVLRTSRSSGPGGQHAQKTESRVEAVFDVAASSALTEVQKRRVVARAGPVLRAVAQDERSQLRNRELAVERLVAQLREALRVPRTRTATKPSAAAKKKRLDAKRRRSDTKRLRGSVRPDS
jgi:ribosome-associated protein